MVDKHVTKKYRWVDEQVTNKGMIMRQRSEMNIQQRPWWTNDKGVDEYVAWGIYYHVTKEVMNTLQRVVWPMAIHVCYKRVDKQAIKE